MGVEKTKTKRSRARKVLFLTSQLQNQVQVQYEGGRVGEGEIGRKMSFQFIAEDEGEGAGGGRRGGSEKTCPLHNEISIT